jgi:hypothetical protein
MPDFLHIDKYSFCLVLNPLKYSLPGTGSSDLNVIAGYYCRITESREIRILTIMPLIVSCIIHNNYNERMITGIPGTIGIITGGKDPGWMP